MMKKARDNPMDKARAAPRCHARSKRTGLPCGAPAVSGWKVCRFHGAGGGAPRAAQLLMELEGIPFWADL